MPATLIAASLSPSPAPLGNGIGLSRRISELSLIKNTERLVCNKKLIFVISNQQVSSHVNFPFCSFNGKLAAAQLPAGVQVDPSQTQRCQVGATIGVLS